MKKHAHLFILILVLALAALACEIPGLNSLPKDDFSSSSSGWGTGTDSASSVEYVDGGFQMIVYQPLYLTWSTPNTESYENVHMEVSVRNDSPDPLAFFGFICNEQSASNSFYYVGVSSDGYYAFVKATEGFDDTYLKEGTSDIISSAASPITLGMDCGNGTQTLYVNGQKIDSISDTSYTSGMMGLFAGSDEQASGANVTFDDFVMSKLGE